MFKKGLAVAVILLFIGVAFTSSINANVSKSSLESVLDMDIIEEDDTEKLSDEDCGCEEEAYEKSYADFIDKPIICGILLFILGIMAIRLNLFRFPLLYVLEENGNAILVNLLRLINLPMQIIGETSAMLFLVVFNCYEFYPY
jgi:hypothetical protein